MARGGRTATGDSPARRRLTIDDIFDKKITVIALLVVLLLCLAVILWLVLSMSRYEREGDALVRKLEYGKAVDKYIKALQRQTIMGRDRLQWKIAQAYAANDEEERAVDILYQLMRDYPEDNFYVRKAAGLVSSIMRNLGDEDGSRAPARGLSASYHRFRKSYRALLAVLVKGMNREANRKRARRLYEQYRADYENYTKILSREYREAVRRREQEKRKHLGELDQSDAGRPAVAGSADEGGY